MNNFQTQRRTEVIVEDRDLRSDKYMCNEHIPNFLNKELKAKRDEVFFRTTGEIQDPNIFWTFPCFKL